MSNIEIEQLRNEADQHRDNIARDVELVTDRVAPGRIADRQKAKFTQSISSVRNRVFGSPDRERGLYERPDESSGGDDGASLTDRASGMVDSVKESTPDSVGEFTEGNPLAAGLIGLGAGLLAATLIPSTREEQQMAGKVQGHVDSAAAEIARSGQAAAENVQPAVTDAAQAVRESATDSAQSVKGDAQSAAEDVKGHAKDQAQSVKD